jgi:hypothetical protein
VPLVQGQTVRVQNGLPELATQFRTGDELWLSVRIHVGVFGPFPAQYEPSLRGKHAKSNASNHTA